MRRLGFTAGLVGAAVLSAAVNADVAFLLLVAFTLAAVGYMLGRLVEAIERNTEEAATANTLAALPYMLMTGQVRLGDLVQVTVPDAPPADLGGER